jgi:hypothetical protein
VAEPLTFDGDCQTRTKKIQTFFFFFVFDCLLRFKPVKFLPPKKRRRNCTPLSMRCQSFYTLHKWSWNCLWHFHLYKILSERNIYTLEQNLNLWPFACSQNHVQYMQLRIGVLLFTRATGVTIFSGKWWTKNKEQRHGIYTSLPLIDRRGPPVFNGFWELLYGLAWTDRFHSSSCQTLYFFFFLPNDRAVLSTSIPSQFLPAQSRPM